MTCGLGGARRGCEMRRSSWLAASARLVLVAEQFLDAADGIAFLVEQAVDAPRELDVGRPVIAAVAGALHRPQLRKARFPIAQDMLGDAELARQFADRLKSAGSFCAGRHAGVQPCAIRSRMIWLARKVITRRGAIGTSIAGLGIAADALALVAQDEGAEAGIFTFWPIGQRVAHMVEHALDHARRFGARQAELAMDDVGEVRAGQRAVGVRVLVRAARSRDRP